MKDDDSLKLTMPEGDAKAFTDCNNLKTGAFDREDSPCDERNVYSNDKAAQFHYDSQTLSGKSEVVLLSDDAFISINDVVSQDEKAHKSWMNHYASIGLRFSGESQELYGDVLELERSGPQCITTVYPDGFERATWVKPNSHVRSIGIYFKPDELNNTFGINPKALSESLQEALFANNHDLFLRHTKGIPEIWQAGTAMLNTTLQGDMRTSFLKAKSTEMLCLILDEISNNEVEEDPKVRLLARDREGLRKIHDLLITEYARPPTTVELCRFAGLNRNKLAYGFRYLYGENISTFCHNLRMNKAFELLQLKTYTISEVAHSVGFNHPQNFSASFKLHFGITPKSIKNTLSK